MSVFQGLRVWGNSGEGNPCPDKIRAVAVCRRLFAWSLNLLAGLACLVALGLSGLISAAQAQGQAPLTCAPDNFYSLAEGGTLRHVTVSGTTGTVTDVFTASSALDHNGLGIAAGGTKAYAYARSGATNENIAQILSYTPGDAGWTALGAPVNTGLNGDLIAGGVDLLNQQYYFGGYEGSDFRLYRFDLITNSVASVGTLKIPPGNSGDNGDLAFDNKGNMFFVQSSASTAYLYTVTQAQLAAGGDITPQQVDSFAVPESEPINGIAFNADGKLYLGNSAHVFRFDPAGHTVVPITASGISNGSDLGSCSSPATFTLQKNVVARADASDQFALTAVVNGVTLNATTAGAATGVQTQQIGPVPVVPGNSVTFSEAMAAGSASALSVYTSAWACTNNGAALPGDSGANGSVTIPAPTVDNPAPAVVCTFSNTPPPPKLTLTKTANPTSVTAAGQTVSYSFAVQNTGADTISGLNITESVFTGTGGALSITCPPDPLPPTQSTTCTASYAVTQADMDAGVINNTATAHGQALGNTPVDSNPSSAKVTTQERAALALTKSASPSTYSAVGDTISYSLLVQNTGNVGVNSLSVADTAFSGQGAAPLVNCPVSTLAVGASTTCTASYSVVQGDLSAGSITNTALAKGVYGSGNTPVQSNPSSAKVTASSIIGVAPVPTLDRWGLALLAAVLAGVGALLLRRRLG